MKIDDFEDLIEDDFLIATRAAEDAKKEDKEEY